MLLTVSSLLLISVFRIHLFVILFRRGVRVRGSMKGRRAERRSRCARDTLASRRSPSSLPSATPFFSLFSPWATWSRTGRHGNPRQSRWKLNVGGRSPSSFSLAFSDIAFRLPSLSLFVNVPTYSYPALSVVSKLSLAPSCSLPRGGLPLCPLPPIALAAKSSPHRPRAPSLPSRPVSLV